MYYVCIENNKVNSILNYEPNVPASVTVETISDEDYHNINNELTHYYDIVTRSVIARTPEDVRVLKDSINPPGFEQRQFLNSTDWKVFRHIREKALGITTSLTEEDYLTLEAERHEQAKSI
jgi:hypothetical protein